MSKYVGSIDQGTTSTRFIIFNEDGEIVADAQHEHEQIMPKEGWVEHDPMEIWEKTVRVIEEALEKASLKGSDLSAVGITNQRETTVVWSKSTGKPLHNAIVWMDMRSQTFCDKLSAKVGGRDTLQEKTGLPIVPYFAGTKLKWLINNVETVAEAVKNGDALFGTIDTWLLWNLSGQKEHLTDVTNASRTLLMDIKTLQWDDELLELFELPRSILPDIKPSSGKMFDVVEPKCLEGVPVSGVLGDQQAALFGQTCFRPGDAKNTYGTGCFLLLNTGEKPVLSTHGLLTTVGYQIAGEKPIYALEGSVAIGGALVQWLRDNLGLIKNAPEVEELANSVPNSGGIYFVPAFSGLYAPYWRDDARGVIVGMTRFTNKGHLARATLESVSYQSCDMFEAMEKDSKVKLKSLRVDGGMVENDTLMQFQANMLDTPVVRPKVAETTALGAAYAAGLAVGVWPNLEKLQERWAVEKSWEPKLDKEQRERNMLGWSKAIQRTYGWIDDDFQQN
ncbi:Glycerol kinase [Hondaea fermentalgiana]|uniref:glycerol kinase n=1 Tax=Hondaea fermentalgiana TaxID=2315210 RepID=A0A2R5GU42_9STRA|nr:Glycerol kinase [Hondaea fermentalgiana]|eukprot:GBG34075.1 Glycerol kinase [Hondaea fermentalgiana]